jgi:hypothetical protein
VSSLVQDMGCLICLVVSGAIEAKSSYLGAFWRYHWGVGRRSGHERDVAVFCQGGGW